MCDPVSDVDGRTVVQRPRNKPGHRGPYNVARRLACPFQLNFTRIISPLVRIMNGSANWILGRFGMKPKKNFSAARTPDELSSMVRRSMEGTSTQP